MSELASQLDFKLVDQSELESSLTQKANDVLLAKESELDEKRLQKTTFELEKTHKKIASLESRLKNARTKISQRKQLKDEIEWFQTNELEPLLRDIKDIQDRIDTNKAQRSGQKGKDKAKEGESEREFLIRTGKITAFGSSSGFLTANNGSMPSSTNLRAPGFEDLVDKKSRTSQEINGSGSSDGLKKKSREHVGEIVGDGENVTCIKSESVSGTENSPWQVSSDEDVDYGEASGQTDSENSESRESTDCDYESEPETGLRRKGRGSRKRTLNVVSKKRSENESNIVTETDPSISNRNVDDGNEDVYQERLREWVRKRSELRSENNIGSNFKTTSPNSNTTATNSSTTPEWHRPHPSIPDAVLNAEFKLPGDVFPSLFDYQKTCVQWLWELYSQKTGGIIGDEMGLGKTIQVIAFLAGLHYSGLLEKPVLLVVPATVMNQWVNEFHRWWPPLRCVILHGIGSGMTKNSIKSEDQLEAHLEQEMGENPDLRDITMRMANNQINAKEIVDRVFEDGHVLVTTYVGLRIYSKYILPREWGYVVLDEGHKIRNPNSEISLACKRVKTHNRVILSGTPIQNNLIELWSLFDFVFPGRLGTLPVFEQQFAVPINMGGYANASNVQVQTGYKCAVILRDLISPYLLRRLKVDVAQNLPKKNEMVLFVKLTQYQQDQYERFLGSEDVGSILKGRRNVLMGVDMLRKICNHPDLIDRELLQKKTGYHYGEMNKSGKMVVLKNLLQLWQSQGHRTLLFCQTKQMLDILEKFVSRLAQIVSESTSEDDVKDPSHKRYFNYLRMDGSTPISKRQQLVDTFNSNPYYHVFLLTTKVGGLGVNLTGADRVIIFDPDWNPSTDLQARERAWRLGQKKDITIYRLMSAGTIEEKIYHRQIFKTFLTNKILKDPKQRRFLKLNDLHDLFTLGDPDEKGTETGDMFHASEHTFGGEKERKSKTLSRKQHKNDDDFYQVASIMGVAKLDTFVGDDESRMNNGDEDKDESRIMEGIFANGAVHSTLRHDDIVDSSHQEVSLIEREANRVAKEAADALKKSRIQARKKAIGTPTWTGKFGSAGRFGPSQKDRMFKRPNTLSPQVSDPLSSSSILQGLRNRSASEGQNSVFKRQKKTLQSGKQEKEALLQHLLEYLSVQTDRFSKSDAILKALPKSVDTSNEKEMVMVRSLLREAAEWVPALKGWRLKNEFIEKESKRDGYKE